MSALCMCGGTKEDRHSVPGSFTDTTIQMFTAERYFRPCGGGMAHSITVHIGTYKAQVVTRIQ